MTTITRKMRKSVSLASFRSYEVEDEPFLNETICTAEEKEEADPIQHFLLHIFGREISVSHRSDLLGLCGVPVAWDCC